MLYTATVPLSCQVGYAVDRATGEVARVGCNAWRCDRCGPRKVRRMRERMAKGGYNKLITLTMKPEEGDAWRQDEQPDGRLKFGNLRRQSASWRKLYKILKRDYQLSAYTWVRELSFTGRLHLHAVVRCAYLPQRRLSALCRGVGFGPVVDIRKIKNKGAINYVSKYLSKGASSAWPRYQRRIQTSVRAVRPACGQWDFLRDWQYQSQYPVLTVPLDADGGQGNWRLARTRQARGLKAGHNLGLRLTRYSVSKSVAPDLTRLYEWGFIDTYGDIQSRTEPTSHGPPRS
jgi:hypothetical protein